MEYVAVNLVPLGSASSSRQSRVSSDSAFNIICFCGRTDGHQVGSLITMARAAPWLSVLYEPVIEIDFLSWLDGNHHHRGLTTRSCRCMMQVRCLSCVFHAQMPMLRLARHRFATGKNTPTIAIPAIVQLSTKCNSFEQRSRGCEIQDRLPHGDVVVRTHHCQMQAEQLVLENSNPKPNKGALAEPYKQKRRTSENG